MQIYYIFANVNTKNHLARTEEKSEIKKKRQRDMKEEKFSGNMRKNNKQPSIH